MIRLKMSRFAGIVAQPLNYLTMSLQATMEFRTYSGEVGKVVSPAHGSFIRGLLLLGERVHQRCSKISIGIWYVITQLGDFSDHALVELFLYTGSIPSGCRHFRSNCPNGWINLLQLIGLI